ncbi:hypothetical protein ACQV5M_21125, partial [Leptospira sp. SA-E8]|uniref:hypothetical protein n=1 Tax=Leptospira sp. SA-E8 TaxID=3422259 RepID=UPI003EBC1B69
GMTPGETVPASTVPVTDSECNFVIKLPVNFSADIYSTSTEGASPQAPWVAPQDGVLLISPWATLKAYTDPNCPTGGEGGPNTCPLLVNAPDGQIVWTVKRNGDLLAKQRIDVRSKAVVESSQGYATAQAIAVRAGDRLFFDFSTRDSHLAAEIATARVHFAYGSGTS